MTPFLVLLSTAFVAAGVGQSKHLDLLFTPMEVVAMAVRGSGGGLTRRRSVGHTRAAYGITRCRTRMDLRES